MCKLYKQVPGVPSAGVPMGVPPTMMAAYPVAMVLFSFYVFLSFMQANLLEFGI